MSHDSPSSATEPRAAPQRARPRRRWLVALLALVIFLAGLLTGGGVTLLYVRQQILQAVHRPERMPARIAERLRQRLDLSPTQVEQVTAILRRRQQALMAIRREIQPRVVTQLDALEAEIAAILTPPQRVQWRRDVSHLRTTWIPTLPPPPTAAPAKTRLERDPK